MHPEPTRARARPRAATPRSLVAVVACLLALGIAVGASSVHAAPATRAGSTSTPTISAASLRTWSGHELGTAAARLDRESQGIGNTLLIADEDRLEAGRTRDAALTMLSSWLAESYRSSDGMGAAASVIAGGDLRSLGERAQLTRALVTYQAGLVDTLDDAEAKLDIGAFERARLVQQLTTAQRDLQIVRTEIARRTQLVADQKADREARARSAAAAVQPAGALVAGTIAAAPSASPAGGVGFAGGSATAQSIDAYLASKGSPMVGNGAAFIASGARYQIDPRLIVAISGAESNFGAITCGPNNAWGWACPNDPEDFATWAHGIETITRGLRIGYFNEGRSSVVLIQQKYAPSGAANDPTGLNNHWVNNVTKFLTEQGGNPNVVGAGPMTPPPLPDLGGLGLVAGS